MNIESSVKNAALLVNMAIPAVENPSSNSQYRQLLRLARANPEFSKHVHEICAGMGLEVFDLSEKGLVLGVNNPSSKFALRMADLREKGGTEVRAGLLLAMMAVCAAFYPTSDRLEDDGYTPHPVSAKDCASILAIMAKSMADKFAAEGDDKSKQGQAYLLLSGLPEVVPGAQRASPNSLIGLVTIALNRLCHFGLIRLHRGDDADEARSLYSSTHRLRINLRADALHKLLQLSQDANAQASSSEI